MNLALPDTPLVKEARALLDAAAPRPLSEHSVRAFLFGRAVAARRALAFDEEDLALAALFHDLGLCPGHRVATLPFPVVSARALREHLVARGVAEARITAMTEAIAFHMQLFPRWKKGAVVGLMQAGAWMDVFGRGRGEFHDEAREIYRAHPAAGARGFWLKAMPTVLNPIGCVGYLFPALFGVADRVR